VHLHHTSILHLFQHLNAQLQVGLRQLGLFLQLIDVVLLFLTLRVVAQVFLVLDQLVVRDVAKRVVPACLNEVFLGA